MEEKKLETKEKTEQDKPEKDAKNTKDAKDTKKKHKHKKKKNFLRYNGRRFEILEGYYPLKELIKNNVLPFIKNRRSNDA